MAPQELVEGLRLALSRGTPLQQAMISFHNSGYKKEDIEEAAKELHAHPSQPMSHPEKPIPKEVKTPIVTKHEPLPKEALPQPHAKPTEHPPAKPLTEKKKDVRKEISKYEEKTKPKGKLSTILIIVGLIIIIGLIAALLIFQKQLIAFLRGI